MPQCQYKKSKKVTLCQKHAKNSSLLVSGGLGTLPRLMELDVCTNQCFKYATIFQLFYSAICQCGAQYQYHNSTGYCAVAYFHFTIQPLLTSCLPSTSLRPQWSSPEIIQSKFIFYNWKHNYKWSSFKKLICIEILADVFSVESLSTIEIDRWMRCVENR